MKTAGEWNQLGVLYFSQGQWSEAVMAYQTAIETRPDFIIVYYNLGLALTKLKRYEEALLAYEALLQLSPEHAACRFQLASLFMHFEKYSLAIDHYLLSLREPAFHFETFANIASCYLKLGNLYEARSYYILSLKIRPNDSQILFNLGVISIQNGRLQDGINYYLQVVKQEPAHYAAHNNLGAAFLAQKNRKMALQHFQAALALHPDNQAIQHSINIIANKKEIMATPPDYVRALFNSYADHYDAHLTQSLQYQLPRLMVNMIETWDSSKNNQWDIADIGCGTGLCGELFVPYASQLVGVDISAEMLKAAEAKHIYQTLILDDIVSFLNQSSREFDLVIAGDVLPYFGQLETILTGFSKIMKKGSLLLFSIEKGELEEIEMTASGRFTHKKTYLDRLILGKQWHILKCQEVTLRLQEIHPVRGVLYLVQKLL